MATQPQQAPSFELGVIPDQKKADQLAKNVLKDDFPIKDEDSYIASWAVIQRHDALIKLLKEGDSSKGIVGFDGFVNGLYKMHRAAVQLRDQFITPLLASKDTWMRKREVWRNKVEQANREKAEREAAALRKTEVKALEKDAAKFEKRGDTEAAEILREQAAKLPMPAVPVAEVVRQQGQVLTKFWDFTVDDYSKVPEAFRLLDPMKETERKLIDSKLNAVISKLGDKAAALVGPGVKIFPATRESSRGK